uniref:Dynein outer arm light chain n=1 Tax=Bigelowiella natans TaxID=227086 RepID=Q5YEU8_BIGNA|nr:dynein outer arm light chain [Bigelowiella natans]|mmetsp:Transcript_15015/g.18013  ORF Transcript_15015/g.18013 Transcript_15015/m.18013 type:complete len:129 (-) Transcript_15015:120-506(-)|eukprot:jgi/Bigna1/92357/estExt_fgenesh1_pm.C_170011
MDFDEEDEGFAQPTYELEPSKEEKFMPHKVKQLVQSVMDSKLKDMVYDDAKVKDMSVELSRDVKDKIKEFGYTRYKIIVQTVMGQVKDQGAYVTSRCLWDHQKDNYASWWFKNDSLFCVCMVFGIYLE